MMTVNFPMGDMKTSESKFRSRKAKPMPEEFKYPKTVELKEKPYSNPFYYKPVTLPAEVQKNLDKLLELKRLEDQKKTFGLDIEDDSVETVDLTEAKPSVNDLDMEAILSIELPKNAKDDPIPFSMGHKYLSLDKYQQKAIDSFNSGKTTIVTAPTGTGKTLIAEYGIEDILSKGKKVIYLSPLKALSNEKYTKFSELFGNYDNHYEFMNSDNVGIITGDVSINPDAQLLVMTTEIYRNMITNGVDSEIAKKLKDFDAVIYDEFHYMNDPDRGKVWEESVMNTPTHMKQMMLSATASNAKQIADWVSELNPSKEVELVNVPEAERHVPLKEYVFGFDKTNGYVIEPATSHKILLSELLSNPSDRQILALQDLESIYSTEDPIALINGWNDVKEDGAVIADKLVNKLIDDGLEKEKAWQIALVLSNKTKTSFNDCSKLSFNQKTPNVNALIKVLNKEDKTPALFFVFSKKRCQAYNDLASKKVGTLLTPEQSRRVLDKVNEAREKNVYLGKDFDEKCLNGLMKGYAVHHAGMLPAYKSLVESLAREGLIKVCFATDTLIAGINMPFKTVVLTQLEKSNGVSSHLLSNSTFKQGAGRSGRRGIDNIGNVIIMPKNQIDLSNFYKLVQSTDTSINSQYDITYSTLLSPQMLDNMEKTTKKTFAYFQNKQTENILKDARKKQSVLMDYGYIQKDENGVLKSTPKGDVCKKIFGVNEIIMTEILTNPDFTKDMSDAELAGMMAIFADVKDNRPKLTFTKEFEEFGNKATPVIKMAETVRTKQYKYGIFDHIPMSTNLATTILQFAQAEVSEDNPQKLWIDMIKDLKEKHLIVYEGDMLRVINGTIDLLRIVYDTTEDETLKAKAESAIEKLKKPPVTDILNYELNIV